MFETNFQIEHTLSILYVLLGGFGGEQEGSPNNGCVKYSVLNRHVQYANEESI
jgi:hypothetical protein